MAHPQKYTCGKSVIKRSIDILGSITGLVLLSPIFVILAILVRRSMGSPVIFRQVRPGKNSRPFHLLKFRSMRDHIDMAGQPLPDVDRLTPFGEKLRATSLDELPSLWNVLKGEMSLVGPRPLLMEYVLLFSPEQARRMDVRPGITGWAQVNGRNAISWEDKFSLDIWYVENRTLWLDLKIIFMTIYKVATRDGISADGQATMPKFSDKK